ncbi:hypothetical protein Tco_1524045 [Tanacetum coccineum]
MDSNLSQPSVSTPVDTRMHKEEQQATGGLTYLGVTSKARANPHLNSGMPAFNLNKPIYSASFIVHSESASGCDASADSTTKADPGLSAPSTDLHVLAYKTKSVSKGLETILTQPITGKGANFITRQVEEDEVSRTIKLKDLAKLVSSVQPSFKDLDSPEDDPVIVVDTYEDKEDEVHATTNAETKDTSVPKSSFPKSSQIQELTNQVLILQSQKHKLEREKNKAEVALLKAQPSFPNMGQLNELLVKSLQTEFLKFLSAHDFSNSLPTELKDLPSKFNELTKEVKGLKTQVYNLDIKLPGDLKEIPYKLDNFTKTVTSLTSEVAELKTLQWELPAEFPLLLAQQPKPTTPPATPATTIIPPIITATTTQMKSPPKNPQKAPFNLRQGKKALSLEETEKENTDSDSEDETHVTGSMVESSRIKKQKNFDFVTEEGEHIHLTEEQINQQKKIEEEAKAEAAKRESEDPITLKVYREDGTSEVIPNFKSNDLHLAELGINLEITLSKQDPLDKLNDLVNKKRKHADDIHDYFKANKRLKQDFVTIKDFRDFSNTMLYIVQEILFRLHQGPGLDDRARTFSSLLIAEFDKRNLNLLKQIRVIEQLRQ